MASTAIITIAMVRITMAASHRAIPFTAAALVALLCGTLSVLSLSAAWVALPAGDTIARLRLGEAVPPATIRAAVDASVRAGEIFESGRYLSDAAMAAGRLGAKDRTAALGGRPLRSIVDEALIAAPVSPHNWARRAAIQLSARDYPGARGSLEMSILLGRYVPGLTIPRLRVIVELLKHAPDPATEAYFADQVVIAARTEPRELAAFADGGAAEGKTQRVLYSDFAAYHSYMGHLVAFRAERAAQSPSNKAP